LGSYQGARVVLRTGNRREGSSGEASSPGKNKSREAVLQSPRGPKEEPQHSQLGGGKKEIREQREEEQFKGGSSPGGLKRGAGEKRPFEGPGQKSVKRRGRTCSGVTIQE